MDTATNTRPRGRMSAYAYFIQQKKSDFDKEHPNEKLNFSKFTGECVESWKKMSESEKKKFIQMVEQDTKRYHSEMAN